MTLIMIILLIIIGKEVTTNRPDIIIKNKKGKTCKPVDAGIQADKDIVQKEAEKK